VVAGSRNPGQAVFKTAALRHELRPPQGSGEESASITLLLTRPALHPPASL